MIWFLKKKVKETHKPNRRKQDNAKGQSRFMKSALIGWAIPRSEKSLALRLLKKKPQNRRSKKTCWTLWSACNWLDCNLNERVHLDH